MNTSLSKHQQNKNVSLDRHINPKISTKKSKLSTHNNNQLIESAKNKLALNYQRRCHTPSLMTHQKRSKSKQTQQKEKQKQKQKLNSQKKQIYYSIKHINNHSQNQRRNEQNFHYHSNLPQPAALIDKPSPFKHKKNKAIYYAGINNNNSSLIMGNKNIPQIENNRNSKNKTTHGHNLTNLRHVRNIQSQLSNFAASDSQSFYHQPRNRPHNNSSHKNYDSTIMMIQQLQKSSSKHKKPSNQNRAPHNQSQHTNKKTISSSLSQQYPHNTSLYNQLQTFPVKQHPLMSQGKLLMKSHNFSQAINVFTHLLATLNESYNKLTENYNKKQKKHEHSSGSKVVPDHNHNNSKHKLGNSNDNNENNISQENNILYLNNKSHNQNQFSSNPYSPILIQTHYLIGVCNFHLSNYQNVIKHLTQVIFFNQQYRKNIYLFLSISYKKLYLIQQALLILNKAIALYPKYVDILLLRAKILSKQKRYYDSIEDLNKCIKLDQTNYQAYIFKADCLRNLTQYKQAIKIYTDILNKGVHVSSDQKYNINQASQKNQTNNKSPSQKYPNYDILLKRAITYIQNQQIPKALQDLNYILEKQPKNSQVYLFKGIAYTKEKNFNQSILSYEQAIKYNTSKKATTKALYQITKLKIQDNDFYGAGYTLERGLSLDIDMKIIQKLKIFIDGAIFIMKKKYKRGIQLLNILSKKQHLNEMIRNLLYSFRSYGHFCLNKYASGLTDLKQLIKCGFVLDSASQFNMTLLEGIIKAQNNQFSEAMCKFQKATGLRKQFGDPQIYKALTKIQQYNRTPKLRSKNTHLIKQSFQYIKAALQKQQNYNYYYLGAVVLYILKDYSQALLYLQQAIQKSEDHVIKHFYLRAMINSMLQKYQQTYSDLNNVISIQKDLKQKENEREMMKIAKQKQKQEQALSKNQNYSQINNYYNDDNQFIQNINNQEKQILQVYLNRAKCYLLFGEKKKAFHDLQTYIGQKPMDNSIHLIAGKLLFSIGACQDAIKAFNYSPTIEKNKQCLLDRIKCYILLKQLNLALKDIQKLIQLGDNFIQFDYYCLSALKQGSKGQQQNFMIALQKIKQSQKLQHKSGNIFSLSDIFFYRGVFYFLLQDYQNAKKYMIKAKNLKKLNNQLEFLQEVDKNQLSEEEYEHLFQNKIFTDKQIDYNIGICELMIGNLAKSREYLKEYEKFQRYVFSKQKQLKSGKQNQSLQSHQQQSPQQPQQQLSLTPFPTSNRLCSIFPEIQYSTNIKFRLSFCLPAVHPPAIVFQTEYKLIQQISMSSIQSRPDAPWIKRNKFGVIFTTNQQLLKVEQDIDIKTQRSNNDYQNDFDNHKQAVQSPSSSKKQKKAQEGHIQGNNSKSPNQKNNNRHHNRRNKHSQLQQFQQQYQRQYHQTKQQNRNCNKLHKFQFQKEQQQHYEGQQDPQQQQYMDQQQNGELQSQQIEEQNKQKDHFNFNQRENLRQMFKIDRDVQEKLNKILKERKEKESAALVN